jgi:hypothetical protein
VFFWKKRRASRGPGGEGFMVMPNGNCANGHIKNALLGPKTPGAFVQNP